MSIYKVCPKCGAHLDPGEQCSCEYITESAANYSSLQRARSVKYHQASEQTSEYINKLSLRGSERAELILLLTNQVKEAETGAFLHGFNMGMRFARPRPDGGDPE